jgi:hypothetical protein
MQAKLVYFKESGKYYSDAVIELTSLECNGQYFSIGDRIRSLSSKQQLPGITSDWLTKENGFIVVLQEDIGYPVLVKHPSNEQKASNCNFRHVSGTKTNHCIKLLTFKLHGKYNTEETMILDESCISNGVALIHAIALIVSNR